jgi:hypothetical protein
LYNKFENGGDLYDLSNYVCRAWLCRMANHQGCEKLKKGKLCEWLQQLWTQPKLHDPGSRADAKAKSKHKNQNMMSETIVTWLG